jgi:hypothetical protein
MPALLPSPDNALDCFRATAGAAGMNSQTVTASPVADGAAAAAPSAPGCRLDPDEISGARPHNDTPSQRMRFAHALEERGRWLTLIDRAEPSFNARERFKLCGSRATLAYSPSEAHYYVSSSACRNRFCPACRVRRQLAIGESLNRYFVNHPARDWQFITLTMRHTPAPLALQLDWLQRCFKTLRKDAVWSRNVTHGFAVLEITRNAKTQQWHPHLHILAHVRFLDWSALRSAWARITRGSNVIDCQRVKRQADAVRYMLAYLGKPPDVSVLHDDAAMIELYRSLHSQHLLIRFGRPPIKPPPAVKPQLPLDLVYLGSIETMIDNALGGDERARLHLEGWLRQRRTDARELESPRLLAAITRGPPKRHTAEAAIAAEADLAAYRADLIPQTPF